MDRQSEDMDPAQCDSSQREQAAPHLLVLQCPVGTIAHDDYQPIEKVPEDELYTYATLQHQISLHHSNPGLAKEQSLGDQPYLEWWQVLAITLGKSSQPANPKLHQPQEFRSGANTG